MREILTDLLEALLAELCARLRPYHGWVTVMLLIGAWAWWQISRSELDPPAVRAGAHARDPFAARRQTE